MAKVHPVAHFFGEDIDGIELPRNVMNLKCFILDPFANGVLVKLDVPDSFQGHIVGPHDACIVVVVEDSGGISVRKIMTCVRGTAREILEVDVILGCCVHSTDFGFAGTKACAFLSFAIFEDDAAVHTVELEQWEECAISNGSAQLRAPTSIAVCQKGIGGAQFWWDSVVVGLGISGGWKMNVGVHRRGII